MTTALAERKAPELPEPVARRGISEAQWRTLCTSLYPGADPHSVLMVWDYCLARRLDPLKKPCHIVPMEVKDAKTNQYGWRDVVMPGIYEHRTTAQRTGEYLGHSKPEYGPPETCFGVTAPEWCELTVYRWNSHSGVKAEFPVRVLFREVVAITKDRKTNEYKANARWSKAPVQMLTKCTEAAGLREAFPDEIGGEQTAEEMDGQRAIDVTPMDDARPTLVKPDQYDDWLAGFAETAKQGRAALEKAWADAPKACREFLSTTDPDSLQDLQTQADDAQPEA